MMMANRSVLLVEDDPADADFFQTLLRQPRERMSSAKGGEQSQYRKSTAADSTEFSDAKIQHCTSLDEGLSACSDHAFDVVLLDLSLPDAQGMTAVDRFVASHPTIPVVVLTGQADEEYASHALSLGAEDYLIKGETSHAELLQRAIEYAIDRKRARHELVQMENHLLKAQRLESLEILAGGVAHDFNNLLVGVLGNASMVLADLSPTSDIRAKIEGIERSALVAAELTRQLLAYAGKGRFVVDTVDLSELVEETKELLRASVNTNATIRFEISQSALPVRVDATQIQQTLMNLVTNASEALRDDSGHILLTTGRAVVTDAEVSMLGFNQSISPGSYAFLEVTDSGRGMDEQTRNRMFDPFYSTKFTGRGLGLAASLGIARGHGGAFRVYSEVDQGTSLKLYLPLARSGSDAEILEEKQDELALADATGNARILVVDDNEIARGIARLILTRAGFDAIAAEDGEEALALFQTHHGEFDLILMDMTMPRLSGEETSSRLRKIKPDVNIIMMSGYNEQEVIRRLAGRGVAHFIQKPYQPEALLEMVTSILKADEERRSE